MILCYKEKINSLEEQIFKYKDNLSIKDKIVRIKQLIHKYENSYNYGYLECPCCHSDKVIFYGSYERNVIIYDQCFKINIKRVMCKECGSTHAIIPSFLIPYYQYEKTFIYKSCILLEEKKKSKKWVLGKLKISRQILLQWIKRFKIHLRYLITTVSKNNYFEYLLEEFLEVSIYEKINRMYFMQIVPT